MAILSFPEAEVRFAPAIYANNSLKASLRPAELATAIGYETGRVVAYFDLISDALDHVIVWLLIKTDAKDAE